MSNIFISQNFDATFDLIDDLMRESFECLCHGNVNKVCINDTIISKHLKDILGMFKYLNVKVNKHTLILGLCNLKRVKEALYAYNVFFEENVSRLKSEYVVRSATEGCMNELVSVHYSIHVILHRIVDSRIRT